MNKAFQLDPLQITLDVLQDENATVVKLVDYRGNFTTGSSKRNNGDSKDYGLGLDIAFARACIKHGKSLLKECEARG